MKALNTFIFSNNPWIRFLRHFLFWATDLMNYYLVMSINTEITLREAARVLLRMPLVIVFTYALIYFVIPRLSQPANRHSLFLWVLILFVCFGISMQFYGHYIVDPLIDPGREIDFNIWDVRRVLSVILQNWVVISMAIAIKLIKNKTELQLKNQELIDEKKAAELNFLKAQMHPHFLFNTLNTLYSDIIHDKGRSEEVILRLSDLLRFILEECNKPLIEIGQEIKVIKDYLELEKLRHGERLCLDLNIQIEDSARLISPMLLLPFVENCCKHTLSSISGKILILIDIKAQNGRVSLYIENDLADKTDNVSNHGMGILNVKKQLELLYGSDYELKISKDEGKFKICLNVPVGHE